LLFLFIKKVEEEEEEEANCRSSPPFPFIIQAQYNTIRIVEHSAHHLSNPCVSAPMVKCLDGGVNHMEKKQIAR
jgi:hypothetical protein